VLQTKDSHPQGLGGADLSGAKGVTNEQLSAAESLAGSTMPSDQKYEE
jgi:hypothetical protein